MARSLNKATLIGNVGADPEIRHTQTGVSIATLSLATSTAWRDRNTGTPNERTEWHRITVFGKLAEIIEKFVNKGSKIYLEGKIQTRKWQTPDGQDRYTTEIIVDSYTGQLLLLDKPESSYSGSSYNSSNSSYSANNSGSDRQYSNVHSSVYPNYKNNSQSSNTDNNKNNDASENDFSTMNQMPTMPVSSSTHNSSPVATKQQQVNQFDQFEDEIPF